ncbi:MAG: hypothetical protein CL917_03490 [Deltaproteobacteria bacterium]|nr:hypothetical protein [Deltaproteobacteria bacterium]
MTLGDFWDEHWPHRLMIRHGTSPEVDWDRNLEGLLDLEKVLRLPNASFGVHSGSRGSDYGFARNLDATDVRRAWEAGAGIRLTPFDAYSKWTRKLCVEIAEHLGLSLSSVRSSAFYSGPGVGQPRHFDGREVFNIQLAGHRTWTIEPNVDVVHPDLSLMQGTAPANEAVVRQIARNGFSENFTDQARSVEMRPGSVIFLPRGYWHETRSNGYSVSLSLGISGRREMDLLLERLTAGARLSERLRAPVGHNGNVSVRDLKAELMQILGDLDE